MATNAQIADAANKYRDAEGSGAPTLTAKSNKRTLLDWLSYLEDVDMPGDMHIDDAWATVKANVAHYIKPPQSIAMGRLA